MVQSARRLSVANQLHAALQTYETAYAQWQSAWLLINIGRIQQKLGRPAAAIATYRHYFDGAGNDSRERIEAACGFLKQAEKDLADQRAQAANRLPEKPIYKKWWLWTTIGSIAVAAAAITAGVVVGTRTPDAGVPANTLTFPLMFPF
jgi:tetratricopeptide (TPR) repeat protein